MAKELNETENALSFDFLHGRRIGFNAGFSLGLIMGSVATGVILLLML